MQSKTTNAIRVAAALGLVSTLCGAAEVQQIPPACAQLVSAMDECTADLANWADYNDPAGAAKIRETIGPKAAQLKMSIQQAVKEKGIIAVAQQCASQDVKQKIIGNMGGMITPVLMNRGDATNCENALAAIQ
jgi:hypothetical protein